MTDSGREDSITHLNTQLNKSMILMENAVDIPPEKPRRSKSIKLNTMARSPRATNSPAVKSRKSILKKTDRSFNGKPTDGEIIQVNGNIESLIDISQRLSSSTQNLARPHNVSNIVIEILKRIIEWKKLYLLYILYIFYSLEN